jgi:hypothetical protein
MLMNFLEHNEAMMKLVEECSGVGDLLLEGEPVRRVSYAISRYQGMVEGSGLPIPGLHRIEGTIDFDPAGPAADSLDLVGAPLALRLADGRSFGITLVDSAGRILTEGHGPSKCLCC